MTKNKPPDKGAVLFATPCSANLRMVSDAKCDWLRESFGVELTDAPTCQGRLVNQRDVEVWRLWR